MQRLRIFVASPSDMTPEREKVKTVASALKPLADSKGIILEVVAWGSVIPDMGRPEQVILDQVKPNSWDIFIGILWHRFGTPPGGKDSATDKEYLSGTEEEFKVAYRLWQNHHRPRIMIYRCTRNIPPDTLNPDQYKHVQDFFKQFDAVTGKHPGLYQTFSSSKILEGLLFDNIQKILLDYGDNLQTDDQDTSRSSSKNIFISYKRSAKEDRAFAEYLNDHLTKDGHAVFIDTSMRVGTEWLKEIDERIKSSDYMIVLVSKDSADSEMVQAEIQRAYDYRHKHGYPKTLPIRMRFDDLFPYTISFYLSSYQQLTWQNPEDNEQIAREINDVINNGQVEKISKPIPPAKSAFYSDDGRLLQSKEEHSQPLPEFDARILDELYEPGGSIKLGDRFYIERDSDLKLKWTIAKKGETVTIRASRQTGKSSLLARGINHVQESANIVYVDLQSIEQGEFISADRFLKYFAGTILRKLRMDVDIADKVWQEQIGPQDKLVKVMEDYVLPNSNRQVILAIDEADRLLNASYQNDFFALMRSWHNNRAMDPEWNKLNLVMVIATEPYLLISNPNQSPFNVGVKINLEDFNRVQVRDLNHRHGEPIKEKDEESFFELFSGHPYLTRKALYTLLSEHWSWEDLNKHAASDRGPFADHLRRQLWFIREDNILQEALRQILRNHKYNEDKVIWRLLRAGLIKGLGDLYYCRCGLYEKYFKERLL